MPTRDFPTRSEIEASQLDSLRKLIGSIAQTNPFYAPRLRAANIDDSLPDLESFMARMPFTMKPDISADQQANPPFGTNLTYPLDRYIRLHQTSSTTGNPLRWLDTRESWNWLIDSWAQTLEAAGATSNDVMFVAFSFGPFIGFWLAFEAAMQLGLLCIPGGSMNTVTRLRAILANDVTYLCCTPTYAIRLGETAKAEGIDLAQARVKKIIVGGEPGGSLPTTRERIERLWPTARLFDHYGLTEVGPATFECPARPNTLHVIEEAYLAEIVDHESGSPVETGEVGELVLTTLGRIGSPLLRYRTGDLVRANAPETCTCGRSTMTLDGGIIARADDMIFVRGVNLFPSAVDAIISRHDGIVEYRVEIDQRDAMTELRVLVELENSSMRSEATRERLVDAFRDTFGLRIPVEIVASGSLPRFELKSRRWIKFESGG